MSTLLLSILGLSIGVQQCSVWKEIAPCTCRKDNTLTIITCERMNSFGDVINILQNRFNHVERVRLEIVYSSLLDLSHRSFKELNFSIENLKLNNDNLSDLSTHSFHGLSNVRYLSLSDNNLKTIPSHVLEKLSNIRTLDLGRVGIRELNSKGFQKMPHLENVVLPGNGIHTIEKNTFPSSIRQLHLGRNKIKDLNNTLVHLTGLNWLFINSNDLISLDHQLPEIAPKLIMIHAGQNRIETLPSQLKSFSALQSLFFPHNRLTEFASILSNLKLLERAQFEHNMIKLLREDDFMGNVNLQFLCLGYNYISSLNHSLLPLRRINVVNVTHNLLYEFSLEEIRGLRELQILDLSYNQISKLNNPTTNSIIWETKLTDLILNDNYLSSLDGALSSLTNLIRLRLGHNKLSRISPDDFIGLDKLEMLDISYNHITTLEETSKTYLPALHELIASFNNLTVLDNDFHGLPVLCWVDLSNNQIKSLGTDLVTKTRCKIEDTLGTLSLALGDNPILCDATLPKLMTAMEIRHAKITGTSHCRSLSEPTTTLTPETYLNILPPISTSKTAEMQPEQKVTYDQLAYQSVDTQEKSPNIIYEVSIKDIPSLNNGSSEMKHPDIESLERPVKSPEIKSVEKQSYTVLQYDRSTSDLKGSPLVDNRINKGSLLVKQLNERPSNDLLVSPNSNWSLADQGDQNLQRKRHSSTTYANELDLLHSQIQDEEPISEHIDNYFEKKQVDELVSVLKQLRLKVPHFSAPNEAVSNDYYNTTTHYNADPNSPSASDLVMYSNVPSNNSLNISFRHLRGP